jgi:ferredoxin
MGYNSTCSLIENTEQVNISEGEIIGIGFPIASFSTYPIVFDFLNKLPSAKGTPVFCFVTMAGVHLWGIIDEVRDLLKRKGYRPIGYSSYKMPPNIFIKIPEKMRARRMDAGKKKAVDFASKLLDGKCRWGKMLVGSKLIFWLCNGLFSITESKWHQRLLKIRVDNSLCNQCGICVKKCPNHNIAIKEKVIIQDDCQYCFRCISVCPQKATFGIATPRTLHYRAEGAKF